MELETIITEVVDGQGFHSFTPFTDTWVLEKQEISSATVLLEDGRTVSEKQRRLSRALCNDISEWSGHPPDYIYYFLKLDMVKLNEIDFFSMSDCTVTQANEFIEYLIEFCLSWNVPTKKPLRDYAPNIGRYVYVCLIHRKSVLTGLPADIHHCTTVGMGNNRDEIIHEGMEVLPLTREEHKEFHDIGKDEFYKKHHIHGIKLDKYLCKKLGLKHN